MNDLKFITDGMLGKLTRWLRMLGHDVVYTGPMDDKELIQKAKNERRILLTRDKELYQHAIGRGAEAFLVEGETNGEKLANLAKRFEFELEIDATISRCPKCNTRIKLASKTEIADRIPQTTASYYNEFWRCPNCQQVYWRGAHWKKIEKTLTEAKRKRECTKQIS
jgi:uncharacterized protein with PIN domain